MKHLNLEEVQNVSGGDFDIQIVAHVGSHVGGYVSDLFSQVINGNINGTDQFMTALNNAITNGANFNDVRIRDITFTDFN